MGFGSKTGQTSAGNSAAASGESTGTDPDKVEESEEEKEPPMEGGSPIIREAKQLMQRAFKSALSQDQVKKLLAYMADDKNLVYHLGLTPAKVFSDILLVPAITCG